MKNKISFRIISAIILTSIVLAFSYNYISPKGIPLVAEKKELQWADDSLLFITDINPVREDSSDDEKGKQIIKEKTSTEPETIQSKKDSIISEPNDIKEEQIIIEEPELKEPQAINLEQAYKLFNQNILFIDARNPEDYKIAHIKNAVNIPMDYFDDYKSALDEIEKNQKIVTYCAGTDCDLSVVLGNVLFDLGYKNVYVFFGGWTEWIEAGYPVVEGSHSE